MPTLQAVIEDLEPPVRAHLRQVAELNGYKDARIRRWLPAEVAGVTTFIMYVIKDGCRCFDAFENSRPDALNRHERYHRVPRTLLADFLEQFNVADVTFPLLLQARHAGALHEAMLLRERELKIQGEPATRQLVVEYQGEAYETFIRAANQIDPKLENGWDFWKFQTADGSWKPVEILRRRFWDAFLEEGKGEEVNYLQDHVDAIHDYLTKALIGYFPRPVRGGSFSDNAREFTRSVAFPLVSMPDGRPLQWGNVPRCEHCKSQCEMGVCQEEPCHDLSPIPRVKKSMWAFPSGSHVCEPFRRCASETCKTYWSADSTQELCPRCGHKPTIRPTKLWVKTWPWL